MKKMKECLSRMRTCVLKHRAKALILLAIIGCLLVAICLYAKGCTDTTNLPTIDTPLKGTTALSWNHVEETLSLSEDEATKNFETNEADAEQSESNESIQSSVLQPSDSKSQQSEQANSAMNNSTQENTSSSTGASSGGISATSPTPEKKWIIDYVQVWVEDSAAWDESVPVYDYIEQSVCNICDATITGSEVSHGKAHMLAGQGSGHHTEVIQTITGHHFIHHEATGHYATAETGGHWE